MVKGDLTIIFSQTINNNNDWFLATSLCHTQQVPVRDKELKNQVLVKTMVMQPMLKMLRMKMGMKMKMKMQVLMRAKQMMEAKLIIVKDLLLGMLVVSCWLRALVSF